MKVRYVLGDQAAHANHGKLTDRQIVADRAAGTNRGTLANSRQQGFFIGIRRPQLPQIGSRSSRQSIVGKDRAGTDHDSVFDRHTKADVDAGVYLDSISNLNLVCNIRLATDDALFADTCIVSNVCVVPNRCAFTENDTVLDDGGFVNPGVWETFLGVRLRYGLILFLSHFVSS